ncbi:hypothetical protein CN501_32160, partial [Bacillus cereus]
DDRAVDQRHQRYRDVGQDHRRGQRPDLAVGGAVAPVGSELGHVHSMRFWGRCVPLRGLPPPQESVALVAGAKPVGAGEPAKRPAPISSRHKKT